MLRCHRLRARPGQAQMDIGCLHWVQLRVGTCECVHSCQGLGMTYAKGWLIMVGASRTSPVPGSGMRRRHERRRTLPSFGALLVDKNPSPTLRGLRMITKALVSTMVLLELYARGKRKQG